MAIVEPRNQSVKSLKGLHLYHCGPSNCSMRVRLTLEEKGLQWSSHHLNILEKEHLTEDYFGINPNGLVPTLVHDGQVMIESDDIIEYLDMQFPEPALRPAKDDALSTMEYWLRRSTQIHLAAVKTYIYDKRIRHQMQQSAQEQRRYEQLQTNDALLEFHRKSSSNGFSRDELVGAKTTLDECFFGLNQQLANQPWIAGEDFSLADIAWMPLHFTLQRLAGYALDDCPNVEDWAGRIATRPSFSKAVLDWWPESLNPIKQSA